MNHSDDDLKINSSVTLNSIIWIQSVPEEEAGISRRIVEDLSPLCERHEVAFTYTNVSNAHDFGIVMAEIARKARSGLRPIIHFEMHGEESSGLRIWPSGEFIYWNLLYKILQEINIITGNNLCCISDSCFGYHAIKGFDVLEEVAFNILIAAEGRLGLGYIEDRIPQFYEELLQSKDVVGAYRLVLSDKMSLFHSQQIFAIILIGYIKDYCTGRRRAKRVERIISNIQSSDQPQSPSELKILRKRLKNELRPGPHLLDKFASKFLIGKPLGFEFKDLQRVAVARSAAAP